MQVPSTDSLLLASYSKRYSDACCNDVPRSGTSSDPLYACCVPNFITLKQAFEFAAAIADKSALTALTTLVDWCVEIQ
jgi:hypothetical protein